jgi:hypothetical protein
LAVISPFLYHCIFFLCLFLPFFFYIIPFHCFFLSVIVCFFSQMSHLHFGCSSTFYYLGAAAHSKLSYFDAIEGDICVIREELGQAQCTVCLARHCRRRNHEQPQDRNISRCFLLNLYLYRLLAVRKVAVCFYNCNTDKWTASSIEIDGKIILGLKTLSLIPGRLLGEWRYSSVILDLSIRWRWLVSHRFTTGNYFIGGCEGLRAGLNVML